MPRTARTRLWPLLAALALSAAACASPMHPRTAEVAEPLSLRLDAHVPLTAVGPGALEGRGVDDPSRPTDLRVTGSTAHLGDGSAAPIPPIWWQLEAHLGLFSPCELGLSAGLARLGAEARCQVLDEHGASPLSAALSAAGAWQPFFSRGGPWARAALDLSRRFGGVVAMVNLAATRGVEGHRVELSPVPDGIHFDAPDPNSSYDGESIPFLQLSRRETRAAAALGVGFTAREPEQEVLLTVGVVPWVVLDAGPVLRSRCGACSGLEVTRFEEPWGLAVTFGIAGEL